MAEHGDRSFRLIQDSLTPPEMQPHDWCLIDSLLSNATRLHMCVLLVYHTQRQKGIFPSQYIPRLFRKEFKYLHLSTFTHLSSSYFYRLY